MISHAGDGKRLRTYPRLISQLCVPDEADEDAADGLSSTTSHGAALNNALASRQVVLFFLPHGCASRSGQLSR